MVRLRERSISRDDLQTSLFTERVASEPSTQKNTAPGSTVETDTLPGERSEIEAAGNVTHVSLGALSNCKIPKLIKRKVRAEGTVPRYLF